MEEHLRSIENQMCSQKSFLVCPGPNYAYHLSSFFPTRAGSKHKNESRGKTKQVFLRSNTSISTKKLN